MTQDEVRRHAREFVGQLERDQSPTEGLARVRELVRSIVVDDREGRLTDSLEYARNWMHTSTVRREEYDEYGQLHDPATELGDGESPGVGLAASAAYLRAAVALQNGSVLAEVRRHLEQPQRLAEDVRNRLSPAKAGFGGELMLESARSRRANPTVARRIDEAKEEIKTLRRDLGGAQPGTDGPAAYGFVLEWGSEVLDAVLVGIVVVVVVVVVVAVLV